MFRFALAAGCAALVADARRTGQVDTGDLDGVSMQTAPPGQCRRRRCPGTNPTIPPPTNAPGEPIQCDRAVPPTHLPAALLRDHAGLHYVGQGANACVYLSDDPPRAIKVSKWPSNPTLWSPRAECEKGQRLHAAACGNDELIAETETYLPTCTGGHLAQARGDDSYIMMHRAGGLHPTTILRLGEGASHKLPASYQKVVFAELVSAIRTIHQLGFTHNDLHDGNVMLDLPDFLQSFPWDRHEDTPDPADAPALPRVAIIDFGEMVPYAQGWKRDYKRDFNSLWDRTAFLANCPDHQARWWSTRGSQAGAEAFVNCLIDQWGVDNQFVETLWVAIHAATAEADDQHIEDLFQTHFVQSHIPPRDRRYPVGDACNSHSLLQSMSTEQELAADASKTLAAPAGYEELEGKCSGSWIENWANGRYAHYGEDNMGSVDDCADVCDEHPECAGFYVKDGKCSHWRSGTIVATPRAGHTCYRKQSDAASVSAPVSRHHGGSCGPVDGYTADSGKCTGHWIEMWANGNYAHYGEDHLIDSVSDCADTCQEHTDCAGFYTKDGKCSHWRSGTLTVNTNPGHCCYRKA